MDDKSRKKLKSCHIVLRNLFNEVDKFFPFVITEGHRGYAKQLYLYSIGRSKTKNSKHNLKPSMAIDVYPSPIEWENKNRMYYLAGTVIGIAEMLDIKIRWGGDWDGDTQVTDQSFNDLGHFELKEV